ncbi:hypothetical protein CPter291_4167 [Collimonas pratensis]|uniref:Uncharacterized protein n=1 Tax=Collimonas pratensis TaxID=279113 RepID=A0ABM5ZC66_9BURK|nr:hypothetical protein CPter291_4167 [Collimonas pratensis]
MHAVLLHWLRVNCSKYRTQSSTAKNPQILDHDDLLRR